MSDKVENYWKILQNVNDWLRFADTKAGALLTTIGVILTLIYTNANAVYDAVYKDSLILSLAIIFAIALMFSAFFCFSTLFSRLKKSAKDEMSSIFFKDVAEVEIDEYKEKAGVIISDDDQLSDELQDQIFENSVIASLKFSKFNNALKSFVVMGITIVLILIKYFLLK